MKICWAITSSCNKNCKYCFRFVKNDVSLSDKKRVLNSLIKKNVREISFCGGEPFLVRNIVEITKM